MDGAGFPSFETVRSKRASDSGPAQLVSLVSKCRKAAIRKVAHAEAAGAQQFRSDILYHAV